MTPQLKEKLLLRKFSSLGYMEELAQYHQMAIEGLKECLDAFDLNPPQHIDWQSWPIWNSPEVWKIRVLPNFQGTQQSIEEGIENDKIGRASCRERVKRERMSL